MRHTISENEHPSVNRSHSDTTPKPGSSNDDVDMKIALAAIKLKALSEPSHIRLIRVSKVDCVG